jgi:septal ring factor EnvC (AmiA/AmiB activator)
METQIPAAKAAAAAAASGVAPGGKDDLNRVKPAVAFVDAKGTLALPAAGQLMKVYGDSDGFGGAEKGVSIATPPKATVATPIDGWVIYAGPYRTYGQLLILNAGGGYYLVMAGMERTNVSVGQFVLAGEAVGSMGDATERTAAAAAIGAVEPVLYIELRKNETPIDPGPWWAKTNNEKAHG